jgi:hypothetical protein
MMEFRDAYIAADQWDNSLTLIKWGLDWLVKAHVKTGDSPAENAFVGQVCASCTWDSGGLKPTAAMSEVTAQSLQLPHNM